jgi:hypothetical protein
MNRFMLCVLLAVGSIAMHSLAEPLRLDGKAYHPNAPIIWAATNTLPQSFVVYKVVPQSLSQAVISNAMAIGSFKPLNLIPSTDKALLHFQDNRDKTYMTRFLKIAPAQGWMSYYDGRTGGMPVKGVPTFEEADRLAMDYLRRLGGDPNQLAVKPRPRIEGTTTSFDKKGGHETNKVVHARGIILYREIDKIQLMGKCFSIEFGNNAKPSMFELNWKNLQPQHRYAIASSEKIINWIKAGKAVNPDFEPILIQAKTLAVTKITPLYLGDIGGVAQEIIYPFAQLEVVANAGTTNQVNFFLHCPIIETP